MVGVAIAIRLSPSQPFSKWPYSLELMVVGGLLVHAAAYVCETEGKPFFMPLLR